MPNTNPRKDLEKVRTRIAIVDAELEDPDLHPDHRWDLHQERFTLTEREEELEKLI